MKITDVPFFTPDWNTITPTEHKGETGTSFWKTSEQGNIRVRMVEYSAGYLADHWCSRGHVGLVLEGAVTIELEDGRVIELARGMSFQVADETDAHRLYTEKGGRLFIVD